MVEIGPLSSVTLSRVGYSSRLGVGDDFNKESGCVGALSGFLSPAAAIHA